METYSFTRKKIAADRRSTIRRAAIVATSSAACGALGFLWPDSAEAFGALRISIFAGAGAAVSLWLTK
jgi:hypothetical protein